MSAITSKDRRSFDAKMKFVDALYSMGLVTYTDTAEWFTVEMQDPRSIVEALLDTMPPVWTDAKAKALADAYAYVGREP